jgi:RHS repeat-associated protein
VRNRSNYLAQILPTFLLITICCGISAQAQKEQQYTQNKSDQVLRSDIRIDPSTHALGIQLPLTAYPQRGGANFPITLYYSSKLWRLEFDDIYEPPGAGAPRAQSFANYAEKSVAGWTSTLDVPKIDFTFRLQSYDLTSVNYGQDGGPVGSAGFIARIHVHLPDGSTHELRKDDAPHNWGTESNYGWTGTYYAVDNSRLRFDFDPGVRSGTLYLADGSKYRFPDPQGALNASANQFTDRNGNTLTFNSTTNQWTDTLGRALPLLLPVQPGQGATLTPRDTQYSIPGMGTSSITYTFKWRYLNDPVTGETVLSNPDPDPNNRLYYAGSHNCTTWPATSLTPRMFNSTSLTPICASQKFNRVVLAEIDLPNGASYRFRYNPYGEIDKLYLPSGGYERYQYANIAPITYYKAPYDQTSRGVTDRFLSSDGTAATETHWQYGIEYTIGTAGPYVATCTEPDGTVEKRYLHAHPNNYGVAGDIAPQYKSVPFGMDDARIGFAYETRIYSSTGTMLRRKLTDWAVTPSTVTTGPPGPYGNRNPHMAKEVEIVLEAVTNEAFAKTTTHDYETANQFTTGATETTLTEFDFVSLDQATASSQAIENFSPGTALRRTETAYMETANQSYRDRNLLGLLSSIVIRDMTRSLPLGVVTSQTSMTYDEYGLLPCGATNWVDPSSTIRGNLTSAAHWSNYNGSTLVSFPTGTYVTTHQQYDQCGSLRVTTDANGRQSQLSYSSAFNYAYPTTATTPVADTTGHGSNQSLTSLTDYDFNTGLVVSTTNANNQLTTMVYNDPLYRLTQVTKPDGGHITYSYSDTPGDVYIRVLTDLDASRVIETREYLDGLGRTIRKFMYQGQSGAPWTVTDIYYDVMGRTAKVSNPYETASASGIVPVTCLVCTLTAYDGLGRTLSVTSPDGAHVDTAYHGLRTLVKDEAGKQRISLTDALGRVRDVWEITASDQWTEAVTFPNHADIVTGYRTHYNYDSLDNLIEVAQSTQPHRFYLYDSLKRLIRSRNVEQGTYGSDITDPITGNSAWSEKYIYDANGNVTQKTDPRGIVCNYSYDALNRNTVLSYSDGTPQIDRYYDGATNGKGLLWYETTTVAGGLNDYREFTSYDGTGRPLVLRQVLASNAVNYEYITRRFYNLAGLVTSQQYPSNRTVTYNYDIAGRLADKDGTNLAFSGTLGDDAPRTYARSISYAAAGQIKEERFGTATAVFNKRVFNSRQQLTEIRASTTGGDTSWNRGKIVNDFGTTNNNGNVLSQWTYIPLNEQNTSSTSWSQTYSYDALNRLKNTTELNSALQFLWQQSYTYDRFGNRTIDLANTTQLTGVNSRLNASVSATTNRLYAPGETDANHPTINYDAAGNQTKDYYSISGNNFDRTYDAENRMKGSTNTFTGGSVVSTYTYDAAGQRVRRKVGTTETWQIYGFDGELVAEYAAKAAATSPNKEYGYRNGQLLISAEAAPPSSPSGSNVAAASSGAVATASSTFGGTAVAGNAINGDHVGSSSWWADNTSSAYPDWVQVDFSGSKTISEVDVFGLQQNYGSPGEPTLTMTSTYALSNFEVQYWTGSAWATIPGASVTGNDKVWCKFTFTALATSKIRVYITNVAGDNHSQVVEIEGYGSQNVAAASSGAVATASSTFGGTAVAGNAINGDHVGSSSWWADNTSSAYPDWVQVDFSGSKTISEVDVFGLQQNYGSPVEPTLTMTSTYALSNFEVQYWTGSAWATIPGASVTGNDKVWCKFTFTALATSKIRVYITNVAGDNHSQVVEIEAYTSSSSANVQWLLTDHVGTPRMIFDQSGSLATVKRHDYLPFGEELPAAIGGRTTTQGFSVSDGVRQQFTEKERDLESGLDYFGARYYANPLGRFTGADAFMKDSNVTDPQSWNKYAYVRNNPLKFIDPDGEKATVTIITDEQHRTGTITIDATIAIYAMAGSHLSNDAVNTAAGTIEQTIERAWTGTYVQDGITYTVVTNVRVSVVANEQAGRESGAQNVIGLWNGQVTDNANSVVFSGGLFGRPDTGQWNINHLSKDSGHEFAHLLGVDDRQSGPYLANTHILFDSSIPKNATPYDYGWALGGAINSHRAESKSYIMSPNAMETRGSTPAPRLGAARDYKSSREVRAGRIWWN